MRLYDFDKVDALALEILHDSVLYKIEKLHTNYYRNPLPSEEDEFEYIDIDDLDELLEDQSLIADCLSLYRSGYDENHIAMELGINVTHVRHMIKYLSKHTVLKDEDLGEAIAQLQAKNKSISEISKILRIPSSQVRQYFQGDPLTKKRTPRKKAKKRSAKTIKRQYSSEIRDRVLKLCKDTEMPYAEIARVTGVNRNTVNRWCKQKFKQQRRKTPLTAKQREEIRTLCRDTDRSFVSIGHGYNVSPQAIARICKGIPRESRVASASQRKLALNLIRTTSQTNVQIAGQVGVSSTTIGRWRRKQTGEGE